MKSILCGPVRDKFVYRVTAEPPKKKSRKFPENVSKILTPDNDPHLPSPGFLPLILARYPTF